MRSISRLCSKVKAPVIILNPSCSSVEEIHAICSFATSLVLKARCEIHVPCSKKLAAAIVPVFRRLPPSPAAGQSKPLHAQLVPCVLPTSCCELVASTRLSGTCQYDQHLRRTPCRGFSTPVRPTDKTEHQPQTLRSHTPGHSQGMLVGVMPLIFSSLSSCAAAL
jgi:hypothetical protein